MAKPKTLGRVDWMSRLKVWRVIRYKGAADIPAGDYPTREEAEDALRELVAGGNPGVTPEVTYDKSLEEFRKASRDFRLIRDAYRAKKIGDEEFLKGKAVFDKASEVADEAETAYIKAKAIPKVEVGKVAPVTPEVTRNLPEIIARLDYSKTVPPEIQSRVKKLLFSLPPELEPNIKRIIVTDKMIVKFGEPGKGYSAQWVDSERIMRLNHRFTDGDFYHEVAHALNPGKSEKEVEQLGRLLEERIKTLPKASGNPGFTTKEAKTIGEELGIAFKGYDVEQFRQGLDVELEHCNVTNCDPLLTGKIAQAHLNEIPDYYTRLAKMEVTTVKTEAQRKSLHERIFGKGSTAPLERLGKGETLNNLLPMPPDIGPPLPRMLALRWPWKKD